MFWKAGLDLITRTNIHGRHETNDLTDDSNSIGAGFVWHHDTMYYTFEVGYATTRLLGRLHDDVYMVRPGFVWEIPRRYTRSSRSQWLFGLAVTLSQGPDGFDIGAGGKLRLDIDFKRMFRKGLHPSTEH